MKTKTMTLLKLLLVISVVSQPISCESEEEWTQYSTEISVVVNGQVRKLEPRTSTSTTEDPRVTPEEPKKPNPSFRGSVKYGQKPFFYGRKFQLPKEAKNQYKVKEEGGLVSPIIMSPIRALSSGDGSNTSDVDPEIVKQNQNEIFSSIRHFLSETTENSFNKTYFAEEVKESENHGGEVTTESSKKEEEEEGGQEEVSRSRQVGDRSRQDGDRSLMLVLPFKANEDNMQELFTKSPLVKVIEDDIVDNQDLKLDVATNPPNVREREILPTTPQPEYSTKKRFRPFKRYRTTTAEPVTTTESGEDATKTYTNYNDVEMITKRYENPPISYENFNHKEVDVTTPYPVQKWLKNKSKTTEAVPLETEKPKRKNQRQKPTTEGPPKPEELSKVLEILPPDMKDLILQIGLNKENKEQVEDVNFQLERAPKPSIDPMSFAVFKPLPLEPREEDKNFVPDDMKEFLASFGLLPSGKRVQKSLNPKPPKKEEEGLSAATFDFLPDDLKSVLEDMGLVKNPNKKEPTRIHIFNPNNHSIAETDEDFEKVNAILTSIKTTVNESQSLSPEMQSEIIQKIKELNNLRYKTGNLSEINNEIQKIVVNKPGGETKTRTARRATKLLEGPDPLMFSDDSVSKNEVKRQGSSSSSSSSSSASSSGDSASSSASSSSGGDSASSSASSSSSSDSTSAAASASSDTTGTDGTTTTTTEESPNIEALKESFGGGETAPDDADIESELPPKRPNGLYLLLDWNSFLEVGTDDDERRVNLRFQPKIGDSRNFLPVTVP